MEHGQSLCGDSTDLSNLKLKASLSLYNSLQNSSSEDENLLLLASLRDLKTVFDEAHYCRVKAEKEIDKTLEDFSSHLELIAINRIVRDVESIRRELMVRRERKKTREEKPRRIEPKKTRKEYELSQEDDKFFEQITKRRQQLLSDVERSILTSEKGTERFGWIEAPPRPSTLRISSQVKGRISWHGNTEWRENDLKKPLTMIRDAARHRQRVSKKVSEGRCTIHNTESTIDRAKIIRKACSFGLCNLCQELLKERDDFWGLDENCDDDESQIIKRLLDSSTGKAAMNILSKRRQCQSALIVTDPKSDKKYKIQRKPAGQAGRGTWATPAYCPVNVTQLLGTQRLVKQ